MSEEPKDPFAEKEGMFRSSGERIVGIAARRIEHGKRSLPFHHGFLDDLLRRLRMHDLLLLGAWSGVGKTQMATQLAMSTAEAGGRVAYIALEAEQDEIEQRMQFQIIASQVQADGVPDHDELNYVDWSLGFCEHISGYLNEWSEKEVARRFGNVSTYYKAHQFGDKQLRQTVMAVKDQVDMVVLDHMHYVDIQDDNENRGYRELTKTIRDCALSTGKPVVVVVHLRKKDRGGKVIVPTLDDIHGSSDIAKICTRSVMLSPAHVVKPQKWYLSPTFVSVPKDRVGGQTRYAAVCQFDRRLQRYENSYALGLLSPGGEKWEPVLAPDLPRWAKGADRVYAPNLASKQGAPDAR